MSHSPTLAFWKMHGLGNDYVVTGPQDCGPVDLPGLGRRLCDRRLGVGADGLLWVESGSDAHADLRMRIFNRDGSEAEMCGNGLRCAVRFAIHRGLVAPGALRVATGAGILACEVDADGLVTADLGGVRRPITERVSASSSRRMLCVDMGNPHAVVFVAPDELPDLDLPAIAAELVTPDAFPEGVNLELVGVQSRTLVLQRTWERGVGETPACGTGAAAVALAAHQDGRVDRALVVRLTGGDLQLELRESADGLHAHQTGPAVFVFEGHVSV